MEKGIVERFAQVDKTFEEIWDEEDSFSGESGSAIRDKLKEEYGFDDAKVRKFGEWFVTKGLKEGWLADERGESAATLKKGLKEGWLLDELGF